MRREQSAGGVVVFHNSILLLKKFNGDWVLPKGRIEPGESMNEAALREVFEEGGARGTIIKYLRSIEYSFNSTRFNRKQKVVKKVHWFLMDVTNMRSKPQKEEGFVEAKYIPMARAVEIAKHDDERDVIRMAIDEMRVV
jgi:8-oxo-dGTP pyrophosphatase MutT (NUDIX family)